MMDRTTGQKEKQYIRAKCHGKETGKGKKTQTRFEGERGGGTGGEFENDVVLIAERG